MSDQKRNNNKNKPSGEFNIKEFTLLVIAVTFLFGSFIYGLNTSHKNLAEKRDRLNKRTLQEVAEYIMEKNPGTLHIDAITNVHPISLNGNVLEWPFYVSDGFLRKFTSGLQSTENIKNRIQRDTLNEDCTKTAFSVFLQKGGVMHYTYHLQKDTGDEFLFEFNNTWEKCLE